jgi:hypothetical protein
MNLIYFGKSYDDAENSKNINTFNYYYYYWCRCDIGGINNSSMWQAEYYNKAAKQNRQVTINDRCGNGVSDFATLEYQQTSTPPARSWEATRGIDPRSFG